MNPAQRQLHIRSLLPTASAEQLRDALEQVLSATASARERDVSDYGIDGSRSSDVVNAEFEARDNLGDDIDGEVLAALEAETGCDS
ncbi:hypothetical protein [Streptomyces anulatus]|uniref:hypothetical protein n=1 Tax=Streptomyces anulatus TaxID=1892 RepID=UPI001C2692AD|nr:hypothetical protein [Streptomyces anulatus]